MSSVRPPGGVARLHTLETGGSDTACQAGSWAVDLKGISYTYEGEAETVITNVSLQVADGEFVLVMGPSGCGKSTLLQVLNGTIPHTLRGNLEGEAWVCG